MPYRKLSFLLAGLLASSSVWAGTQINEPLADSVRTRMSKSISDRAVDSRLVGAPQTQAWLQEMSGRLAKRIPDEEFREDFLGTVFYEASRAGLDPELVLGLIEVESAFRKYAISSASARGYMQVMPFWVKEIGNSEHNLFHLRTNLRYGCTILRHYLDRENGDLFRALGRYNGSLGKAEYPNMVLAAWKRNWTSRGTVTQQAEAGSAGRGGKDLLIFAALRRAAAKRNAPSKDGAFFMGRTQVSAEIKNPPRGWVLYWGVWR